MIKTTIPFLLIGLCLQGEPTITLFLIGDSTMSIKEDHKRPETGWGMPFATFFTSEVSIQNHAKNGRSTRTFIDEGRWDEVLNQLKTGDYVFIQFGHNDESPTKVDRYTTIDQYKANLMRFIDESRAKSAIPILFTPVTRRQFDDEGLVKYTHVGYSETVREVSKAMDVPLIDMDESSRAFLQSLGIEKSKKLFLQLQPGEHVNYPEGVTDNTHFNENGALQMAWLVKVEMIRLEMDLVKYFNEE